MIYPYRFCLVCVFLFVSLVEQASSESVSKEILDKTVEIAVAETNYRRYTPNSLQFLYPVVVRHELQQLFGVPICFEWSYVDEIGRPISEEKVQFDLTSTSSFQDFLLSIEESTNGALHALWIEGSICLVNQSASYEKDNLLDIEIDFEVSGVSTWEALKQLAVRILDGSDGHRDFRLLPTFLDYGKAPSSLFVDDNSISLNLHASSARDVLCSIIRESPLKLSYLYSTHWDPEKYPGSRPSSQVLVDILRDSTQNLRSSRRLTRDEVLWWVEEVSEASSKHLRHCVKIILSSLC